MKRFILTLFIAAVPLLAQAQKDSLASLIEAGNRKVALERIRAGADVNEAQPDGTRPIHWAVYKVDYEIFDALIAKKAKVDVSNQFGATPLGEAAKLGDARMVKALLGAGAKPDTPNQDGETPLMLAIKTGELPVVEMLIKAGANVNAKETFHNQTALMWAAAAPKSAAEMVKILLAKDADVRPRALYSDWESQISSEPRAQYRPTGGLTALLYAARDGCYDCVEGLIGSGADVNVPTPEGVTALMLALDNESYDVAKLLLDHGANPHVWDWWGRTALYIAVDRRANTVTPTRGVLGNIQGRGRGVSPARGNRGSVSAMDIINALLAAGVDVNPQLNMHRPSRGGNSGRFIEEFLNTGCTPLMRATIANDVETVRVLLDKGANPNIVGMGLTPFLIAAGVGNGGRRGTGLAASTSAGGAQNPEIMDMLLAHGADINAKVTGTQTYSLRISRAPSSTEGMTALHVAVQTNKTDLVRYLIEKGASPEILDTDGKKPIDLVGTAPPTPGGGGRRNATETDELRVILQSGK